MKSILVYAWADLNKNGQFFKYSYALWRHPVVEWATVLEADTLGMGFKANVPWEEYDFAVVFDHDISIGSTRLIKTLNPDIKIMTIAEPPPDWLTKRTPFGFYPKLADDFGLSDIVGVAHEVYLNDWRKTFKIGDKMVWMPTPINIGEHEKRINIEDRNNYNILASTTHCNFVESSLRSYKVINKTIPFLPSRTPSWKTRCFYASSTEELKNAGLIYDEACPFIWNGEEHIKRLNQCKIFVDDNICPASGHMTLEMACLGIPSVGSNDFIDHLFPELGIKSIPKISNIEKIERPPEQVKILSDYVLHLAQDEDFYNEMVKKGKERLYKFYSYESCKKRLMETLKSLGIY